MRAALSWVAAPTVAATVCTPAVNDARSGVSVIRPVPITLMVCHSAASRGTVGRGVWGCASASPATRTTSAIETAAIFVGLMCLPASMAVPPPPSSLLDTSLPRHRFQEAAQPGEGLAPMAHAVLVRGRGLAEGAAEGRIEEEGIVAEAIRTPGLLRDEALDRLLRFEEDTAVPHHGHRARELRAPLVARQAAQLLEQEPIPIRVARAFSPETARIQPGPTVERVDADPGIVGHGQQAGPARVVARLE